MKLNGGTKERINFYSNNFMSVYIDFYGLTVVFSLKMMRKGRVHQFRHSNFK